MSQRHGEGEIWGRPSNKARPRYETWLLAAKINLKRLKGLVSGKALSNRLDDLRFMSMRLNRPPCPLLAMTMAACYSFRFRMSFLPEKLWLLDSQA
jgi:hypothetical protein